MAASGTTTTKVFGVGPVIAVITVGLTRDVGRFADKDHFAAYSGSAPIEVSSGKKKIYRLSMRGSRQLNHALHMAAVTQVRHRHSQGRAYYDKKVAQGKTGKEALRALKRRISDALFAAMVADGRRAEKELGAGGPGGQTGNGSVACAAGSHPAKPALRPSHFRAKPKARPSGRPRVPPASEKLRENSPKHLDIWHKENSIETGWRTPLFESMPPDKGYSERAERELDRATLVPGIGHPDRAAARLDRPVRDPAWCSHDKPSASATDAR